ncbi:MAG: hormogonium polysaccharide biosynthesis glycosyltransferase HpsE [Cyanobacteriota bacterium]|nr:hormogonium polysaccharide biosynthesis glycosyltransferase HpsE [Cyanobacteriota bacterium]
MLDFTLVIPTYNRQHLLPELLDRLQQQTDIDSIAWEIIIVDNNSKDDTANIIRDYQNRWDRPYPLEYILEIKQGAAFARQRGLKEAKGEFVGFLDDDNLPALDWVFQAHQFGKEYKQAGAFGGQIHPIIEGEIPDNFDKIKGFLAIREAGDKPRPYQPEVLSLPVGAALVVRRQAWLDCVPQKLMLSGKVAESMVQGDDWEPLMYLYKNGWKIWYNPKMHSDHKIPAWRLEREYLLSLIQGSCLSFFPLRAIVANNGQKLTIFTRTVLGNSYRALWHWLRYRDRLKTDIVAACELQIYLSRIASPFYYLKMKIKPGQYS